jgi:hypothetical protein
VTIASIVFISQLKHNHIATQPVSSSLLDSIPDHSPALPRSVSSMHSDPETECRRLSVCKSAPACQDTRRSILHKSCHSYQSNPGTYERNRWSKTCSWSRSGSETNWSWTANLLAGKNLQSCWMYNLRSRMASSSSTTAAVSRKRIQMKLMLLSADPCTMFA